MWALEPFGYIFICCPSADGRNAPGNGEFGVQIPDIPSRQKVDDKRVNERAPFNYANYDS